MHLIFCMLISYHTSLLNSFIRPTSIFVASFGFCTCKIVSSAERSFYYFLPVWIAFMFFSCLVTLARACNSMLNGSGRISHPFLVTVLRRAVVFSSGNVVLAVDTVSLNTHFGCFYKKQCWSISNPFSVIWENEVGVFLLSVNVVYDTIDIHMLNHPSFQEWIPVGMTYYFFAVLLTEFASILLRILH